MFVVVVVHVLEATDSVLATGVGCVKHADVVVVAVTNGEEISPNGVSLCAAASSRLFRRVNRFARSLMVSPSLGILVLFVKL